MQTQTESRIDELEGLVNHIRYRISQAREQITAAEAAAQPLIVTCQQEAERLKLLLPLERLVPVIQSAVAEADSRRQTLSLSQALKDTLPNFARDIDPRVWPHLMGALQGHILGQLATDAAAELASRKAEAAKAAQEAAARDKAERDRE